MENPDLKSEKNPDFKSGKNPDLKSGKNPDFKSGFILISICVGILISPEITLTILFHNLNYDLDQVTRLTDEIIDSLIFFTSAGPEAAAMEIKLVNQAKNIIFTSWDWAPGPNKYYKCNNSDCKVRLGRSKQSYYSNPAELLAKITKTLCRIIKYISFFKKIVDTTLFIKLIQNTSNPKTIRKSTIVIRKYFTRLQTS